MNKSSKKSSDIRCPLEMKKKALMELAESGDTEAVARHYNISKQTVHKWKSGLKRKNKKFESKQIQDNRHFQELLKRNIEKLWFLREIFL